MTVMVHVRPVRSSAMPRVTMHFAVVTMGSASPGTTPSGTTSSLLRKVQHLAQCVRGASSSQVLTEDQLMFSSQAGLMDLEDLFRKVMTAEQLSDPNSIEHQDKLKSLKRRTMDKSFTKNLAFSLLEKKKKK